MSEIAIYVISAIIFAAIAIFHALSVFADGAMAYAFRWVSIFLHLPLAALLLLAGASLKLFLLIFTASAFLYTALCFLNQILADRAAKRREKGKEADEL